jgi:hypothetical protein
MHPQAIASVIADEICQQHALYRAVRLAPLQDHPQPAARETWEEALEAAYWQGMVSRIHVLDPSALVHRCYTVYQSCVYEAIARKEALDLVPHRLALRGHAEKNHFVVRLNAKKPWPSSDPALVQYRELASAWQFSTPEQDVYKAAIRLDGAIEAQLSHTLHEDIQCYGELSPTDFRSIASRMATRCLQEIGQVILGALGTTLPAYAAFLGVLHWRGQGYEVDFTPSSALVDTLEISAMRRARTGGR